MKNALGKGLNALFPDNDDENLNSLIKEVKINDIEPNINQPRKNFDDEKLKLLSESIKEQGIIQPIVVKKDGDIYKIIAGERRWRAARIAGLQTVPVIIKDVSDKKSMEIALIENIQREDLNPIEEAEAYEHLINEYEMTQEEISTLVGKSRPAITNYLRILKLSDNIKRYILDGSITGGHARAILSLEDDELKEKVVKEIIENDLSVRETEKLVNKLNKNIKNEKNKAENNKKNIIDETSENIAQIEEKLKKIFGTKVVLQSKKDKGKILIEFYSKDELDRILDIINKFE